MLVKKLIVFSILLTAACGSLHKVNTTPAAPVSDLSRLQEDYAKNRTILGDEWPSRTDCDALLWAGLAKAAGENTDLSEAEYAPGEMHRRPPPECYPDGAASTISGDMLLGYMWGLWRSKDLAALQRLADFGEANNWTMGVGAPSRVQMRYNDYVILAHMIYTLSNGADVRRYHSATPVYFDVTLDYARHLQVLSILLYGEVYGSIDLPSRTKLKEACDFNPKDALFQAACGLYSGDMSAAVALLIDPAYVAPTYVRGDDAYSNVHWLFAAKIALNHLEGTK